MKLSALVIGTLLTWFTQEALTGDFDRGEWSVRCWNGETRLWEDHGIEAMTFETGSGATKVTNSSGIHRHAHLVFPRELNGDFTFTIEVKGGYELGFLNREGRDEMLYLEIDETAADQFHTYELSREGTRYTIRRDERARPLVHFRFDYGDEVMITLALKEGESASIRSYRFTPAAE